MTTTKKAKAGRAAKRPRKPPPKRPHLWDDEVERTHMARIRGDVETYLRRLGEGTVVERHMDLVMRDVAKAMRFESDGYRIASRLEDVGMRGCTELVELMDHLAGLRWDAHRQIVARWVAMHRIRPALHVGARVRVLETGSVHGAKAGATLHGVIAYIDVVHATYTVRIPSLGHVTRGPGTLGAILPYEEVTAR